MKKSKKNDILDYVAYAKGELGLRDWTINIRFDIPKGDRRGGTNYSYFGRKVADLRFPKNFHKQGANEIRSTIVHELLHCHFAPLVNAADNYKRAFKLTKKTAEVHDLMFTQNMEYCVDAIATEWADNLEEFRWT